MNPQIKVLSLSAVVPELEFCSGENPVTRRGQLSFGMQSKIP